MNFLGQAVTASDALPLIDRVARADDRWLFIATLLVAMSATAWLVRWLAGSYAETVEKLSAVIQSNTDAIQRNSELAERNAELQTQVALAIETCRRSSMPRP